MALVSKSFRDAAVHVVPPKRTYRGSEHEMRTSRDRKFQCRRCARLLPDSCFQVTRWNFELDVMYLHPFCDLCRDQARSEHASHPLVTPALQRYARRLCRSAKAGAVSRDLVWALGEEDVVGLYITQGGLCAMTGRAMAITYGDRVEKARDSISIDRIDNARHYTLDNVQLVCRAVNLMRMDMSLEVFGDWCKRVVLHALDKPRA